MANSSAQAEVIRRDIAAGSPAEAATALLLQLVLDDLAAIEADIADTRPSYVSEEGFLRHAGGLLAYAREQFDIARENVDGLRAWWGSGGDFAVQHQEELSRLDCLRELISQAEAAR